MYNNKIEEDSKFYLDKINILQQKNEKLSEEIFLAEKENKSLKNQIDNNNLNLKYKYNLIQKLNEKIHSFSNEYNIQVNNLEKNNSQSQNQVEQLFIENEKLIKENNELNMAINIMNEKIKESLVLFNNKKEQFNKIVESYKIKLIEYKQKIVLLKTRIDELLGRNNNKYLMRKDNSALMMHNNMSSFGSNKLNYQNNLHFTYGKNNFI